MTSKERILAAIRHEEADRVPMDVWMYNPDAKAMAAEKYGDLDTFFDAMHIDMVTAFPTKNTRSATRDLTLDQAMEFEFPKVDDEAVENVRHDVEHYGNGKNMAVFAWTPGIFEASNTVMGMENVLMEMVLRPELLVKFYERLAEWGAQYADLAARAGADVIHISDDWGQNNSPLFNPDLWYELVAPPFKKIVGAAKQHDLPVSVHSDGYVYDFLPGIVEAGVDVLHPIQASAGMDAAKVKEEFGDRLCLYGTFDITYTLPRGTFDEIRAECEERMRTLKKGGGFIFCTAHTVNPDVTLDRVEYLYKLAYDLGQYDAK